MEQPNLAGSIGNVEETTSQQSAAVNQALASNPLFVTVLLQFQDVFSDAYAASWDNVGVAMYVMDRVDLFPPVLPNDSSGVEDTAEPLANLVFYSVNSDMISNANNTNFVKQEHVAINLNDRRARPRRHFDVHLTFCDNGIAQDWCITASCFIGFMRVRRVLYPVRRIITRQMVMSAAGNSILFCSFEVEHPSSTGPAVENTDALIHVLPSREEIQHALEGSDDPASSNPTQPIDASQLLQSDSHGKRPVGPNGRLMTIVQRRKIAQLKRQFQNQSSRDWKKSLKDEDLYPLFTLGRDECAREMGTCPTWLKVRMRERGIKVWPNRKLIPTTGTLYKVKQARAALVARVGEPPLRRDDQTRLSQIDAEISRLRVARMKIVRESTTDEFFQRFTASTKPNILDPDWAA